MFHARRAYNLVGNDGHTLLVKYKDGEKKVVVPPETPIVTFVPGDKSELKVGAKIIIFGAAKKEDGTLEAARVNIVARRHHPADVTAASSLRAQRSNPEVARRKMD